jgi:hypothetical protein
LAEATDVPGVARRRDRRVTGRIIVRLVQAQESSRAARLPRISAACSG